MAARPVRIPLAASRSTGQEVELLRYVQVASSSARIIREASSEKVPLKATARPATEDGSNSRDGSCSSVSGDTTFYVTRKRNRDPVLVK